MIRVAELQMSLDFTESELKSAASKRLRININEIESVRLYKKSVDARKKEDVRFVCTADVTLGSGETAEKVAVEKSRNNKIKYVEEYEYVLPEANKSNRRPVVVGFGPAGMFAGLILAQCGLKPIILERGESIEKREKTVGQFWKTAKLNTNSNVQFGEGGAGTFSDGKLTTGTKDERIRKVLDEFVFAGAPKEILYEAKPHIGTDNLPKTVMGIRKAIEKLGGEIQFETKLESIDTDGGKVNSVKINNNNTIETIECSDVIMAIGHSARDTFEMLFESKISMEAKSFSVGARIEHPQDMINQAQYGKFKDSPYLGSADYKLSRKVSGNRGVYTFCMCPGGFVTGAASEENMVVTNGMSTYKRDAENANSAVLVGVEPEDFGTNPLDGIAFQRDIESKAFTLAGGDYSAPVQRFGDLLSGEVTTKFGAVKPTYMPSVANADISKCLPSFVTKAMCEGISQMGRILSGFDMADAVLAAPETRSSSPVRVIRNKETLQSLGVEGLFPCGEGAGYAGGIVSAAVDGIKCAEKLVEHINENS